MLDAEIHLVRAIGSSLPAVLADVTLLRQVFSNLLTNALHYTPAGGEITVQVVGSTETVRFSVANTGSALDPLEAAQVFQPFWRAAAARERDKGGSGLGLAISREIIALHGGQLTVTSHEQQVIFTFTLPSLAL
jgi:signal transduction histidine kinase